MKQENIKLIIDVMMYGNSTVDKYERYNKERNKVRNKYYEYSKTLDFQTAWQKSLSEWFAEFMEERYPGMFQKDEMERYEGANNYDDNRTEAEMVGID